MEHMGGRVKSYLKTWWILTLATTQVALQSRLGAIIFISAKLIRYLFFLYFLIILVSNTKTISGFTIWQVIFFFATFNLVDTLSQFLLREVYRFRNYIVSGFFDQILLKPISPLFRSLFGGSDVLDLPILLLSIILIFISASQIPNLTFFGSLLYVILIVNALIIALSLHIFVLGMGILTTTVDNTILLYRDITQMGRFPVDIYKEPIRGLLTFALPVAIMMTFPAKALMGLLSINFIIYSVIFSFTILFLSIKFWGYSIKKYQSASS